MARNESVALSEEEKQQLKDARLEIFSTNEVPYGVVIDELTSMVVEE